MTGKIKIALCMSGEPRSSMFCFPYIYESLLSLEKKYNVDIYIHSWKYFRALHLYNPKSYVIENEKPREIRTMVDDNFSFSRLCGTTYFLNHNLLYYGIKECFNLINEKYDIYIKCRPDLIFESKLVLDPIFFDIINNKYDLFSAHSSFPTKPAGIDDQLFICNYNTIKLISTYFDQMHNNPERYHNDYYKRIGKFCAEEYLSMFLKSNKVRINHNPLSNYTLVRCVTPYIDNNEYLFLDE